MVTTHLLLLCQCVGIGLQLLSAFLYSAVTSSPSLDSSPKTPPPHTHTHPTHTPGPFLSLCWRRLAGGDWPYMPPHVQQCFSQKIQAARGSGRLRGDIHTGTHTLSKAEMAGCDVNCLTCTWFMYLMCATRAHGQRQEQTQGCEEATQLHLCRPGGGEAGPNPKP